jgi:hypothetical protein
MNLHIYPVLSAYLQESMHVLTWTRTSSDHNDTHVTLHTHVTVGCIVRGISRFVLLVTAAFIFESLKWNMVWLTESLLLWMVTGVVLAGGGNLQPCPQKTVVTDFNMTKVRRTLGQLDKICHFLVSMNFNLTKEFTVLQHIIQGVSFKTHPPKKYISITMIQKLNPKLISCAMESPNFLRDVRVNVNLVTRLLLSPVTCSL